MSEASILDAARGVLPERFGVALVSADSILHDVARRHCMDVSEFVLEVVDSCTSDSAVLPQPLRRRERSVAR